MPVRAPDGRVLGHVQGGLLLNRNLAFIDHINEIVYPEGACPSAARARPRCSSTTCASAPTCGCSARRRTERAIGTRVSQQVRDRVLGQGHTWLDRAFVVNDWYVSAYQPLADGEGRRVGMLYVGFLERPFTLLKWRRWPASAPCSSR
jgi:two-component system, NtrC family, sensor kinase